MLLASCGEGVLDPRGPICQSERIILFNATEIMLAVVPVLLGVLAIAQMSVHLAFFLNISSAPDQTNNFLALLFGIFVTGLVVFGSMLIMSHLNHAMVPMDKLIRMQR
jgi:heme/copper-type cytochrome/quinol oxidase subunit 4